MHVVMRPTCRPKVPNRRTGCRATPHTGRWRTDPATADHGWPVTAWNCPACTRLIWNRPVVATATADRRGVEAGLALSDPGRLRARAGPKAMLMASCAGDGATAPDEPGSQAARPSVPTKTSPSRAARSRLVMLVGSSWLVDPSPPARAKTAMREGRHEGRAVWEGGSCRPVRELSVDYSPRGSESRSAAAEVVGYSAGPSAGPMACSQQDGKVRHTFATSDRCELSHEWVERPCCQYRVVLGSRAWSPPKKRTVERARRSYRSPLRERRAAETRNAILAAARPVVHDQGMDRHRACATSPPRPASPRRRSTATSPRSGCSCKRSSTSRWSATLQPVAVAERPEFAAIGRGSHADRTAAAARLLTANLRSRRRAGQGHP